MRQNYHQLPVYQHRNEIITALEKNQTLIVESPTGSGKTTQLPLILHEAGYSQCGIIGITQPRRIATLSVCDFISRQLQLPVGEFVGYKMRFEDVTSPATKIKVMTDGTLLQELKHDPLLLRYSVLMVDEAHERSLTIDFILGLLKDILHKRPEFRLLVSSATIRTEIFSQYFFQAPVISIHAESFPVQVIYRVPTSKYQKEGRGKGTQTKSKNCAVPTTSGKNYKERGKIPVSAAQDPTPIEEQAMQICDLILQLENREGFAGDVLVFLPGEANIRACLAALLPCEKEYGIYTLPLYARLGKEEQQRIFENAPPALPDSKRGGQPCRKVILATNIAETSITIEGVTVVIDTGLAKLSHFDSYSQHSELRESGISKASAEQRKGRAGRIAAGLCYRLYSRNDYQAMRAYTQEEIQRTDLSEVILRMAELGIDNFEHFDFLTKPQAQDILNAVDSLIGLGALDTGSRQLTSIGKEMCYFPLQPRHSRILVEAIHISSDCIEPSCVITAFLSSNSPFLLPHGQEREAREAQARFTGKYGDFEFYLHIFRHYNEIQNPNEKQDFCERYFLDPRMMHELECITEQLKDIIRHSPSFAGVPIFEESVGDGGSNRQGRADGSDDPGNSGESRTFRKMGARYHEEYMRACLAGLKSGLCIREEGGGHKSRRRPVYRNLTNHNIIIHPGSSMRHKQEKYILAGEVMRTSQTYARSVSLVESQWIDRFDPKLRKNLECTDALASNVDLAVGKMKSSKNDDEKDGKPAAGSRSSTAEDYLAQLGGKLWQIRGEELLWLGQSFPLLNRRKLLDHIRKHFAGGSSKPPQRRKQKKYGGTLRLVPHIQLNCESLQGLRHNFPDLPPEFGVCLYFGGTFVLDGLMLSDVYRLLHWERWGNWDAKVLAKTQGKLRSSYDIVKGRMKAERKALLKHLDLLFTPVCLEDGMYGLEMITQEVFRFRPFSHFSEMLQATSLALETLAEQLAAVGEKNTELPDELKHWLEHCDALY